MKYEYDIYTSNGGNATALFKASNNIDISQDIINSIYQNEHVDQIGILLDESKDSCTFKLVGGEFCGNACLTACGYMYRNHNLIDGYVINKIMNNNEEKDIKIKCHCNDGISNLLIPKDILILNSYTDGDNYVVQMNGITHIIVPRTYGKDNIKEAKRIIEIFDKDNKAPNVFGVIFLDNNKIDPFIWIKRIKLLQNQESCLSGSIASSYYLSKINNSDEYYIKQPTDMSYRIMFNNNFIDITGKVEYIRSGQK